jgi:hypothetical protein
MAAVKMELVIDCVTSPERQMCPERLARNVIIINYRYGLVVVLTKMA